MRNILPDVNIDNVVMSLELEEVQSLMPIDPVDRENLKKDIEKNGLREPLKVYRKGREFHLLAGFNRLEICKELKKEKIEVEILNIPEDQRKQFAIDDNLNRRHLTPEQKRELIKYFLKADSTQSNRTIAKKTGSSKDTVKNQRKILESGGEISHVTIKGADGKEYTKKPERQKDKPVVKGVTVSPFTEPKKTVKPEKCDSHTPQPDKITELLEPIKQHYKKLNKNDKEIFKQSLIDIIENLK